MTSKNKKTTNPRTMVRLIGKMTCISLLSILVLVLVPQNIVLAETEATRALTVTIPPLPAETDTPKSITNETDIPKSFANLFGENTLVLFIRVGIALLIIIAIIIAVLITRGKKNKNISRSDPDVSLTNGADSDADRTDILSDTSDYDTRYTIKLSNPNDPSQTWTLPIIGDLLIGRSQHCPVCLHDKSVSREQCKIVIQGNDLTVVHIGLTNKTILNGGNVVDSSPLQSGDTLKFGREVLHVDYFQTLGSPISKSDPPNNPGRTKTESLF